jgi:hypothetical protein
MTDPVLSGNCRARLILARLPGTARPILTGRIYFFDSSYEISRLVGFQVENISNPNLSRYLRSFESVADAIGDYLFIDGKHFYMLSFPVSKKQSCTI